MGSIQGKQSTFDYVVVGGGTAGCAIASRLSQHLPQASIAVIEAGPDITSHSLTQEPFAVFQAHNSDLDWAYHTIPQPQLGNRQLYSAAGKGLGGGSAINYGAWSRGCKLNYDLWADIVGDEKWNYDHMLPYLKKIESYSGEDSANHGTDGPIHTASITASDPDRKYALREPIRAAYEHAGLRFITDSNSDSNNPIGVSEWVENWRNGKRQISADAYNLSKTSVTILVTSPVQRVLIDNITKRATGIELTTGHQIHATKEIILSAGTYRTPQILMLSGVGPTPELAKHSIPIIHANPSVGSNLHDHPALYIPYKLHATATATTPNLALGSPTFLSNPAFHKGFPWDHILTGHSHSSTTHLPPQTDPQTTKLSNPHYAHYSSFLIYAPPGPPLDNTHLPSISDGTIIGGIAVIYATTSRGTVTLSSPSSADPPTIDTRPLTTPHDLFLMRTALREHLTISLASPSLTPYISHDLPPPGYKPLTVDSSDADLDERILGRMQLLFHPGGTAALGSVVDSSLRVFGVSGLRVCDASVMPTPISAYPQATVYVLAERAAEMIAADG